MSRLADALDQIALARRYNLERVGSVPLADWFTIPPGNMSHMAWQVGHIAASEYRLCLNRLRPRAADDESLISDDFLKTFARDSLPAAETGFTAAQIRAVFDRVHSRVMEELPSYPDADLDLPPLGKRGSFPVDSVRLGPGAAALMQAMEGPRLREAIATKFGLDLSDAPTMVTLRGWTNERDGNIHCDSLAKRVTVLLYLNKINGHVLGGGQPMYTGPGFVTQDNAEQVQQLAEEGTR